MKRFEENQFFEIPAPKIDESVGIMVVYQKIEPNEWTRVEIPYKKKEKL